MFARHCRFEFYKPEPVPDDLPPAEKAARLLLQAIKPRKLKRFVLLPDYRFPGEEK